MFDEGKIKAFIKENTDNYYSLLKELCSIPAPSLKEEKRAEFCLGYFKNLGFDDAYIDDANNAICQLGSGDDLTVFAAHTDTVFPDTEPMPFFEKDGKIYSPGVGDDTACVTALLLAAKFLKQEGFVPKSGILFVCNSGEEGLGNLKGMRAVMKAYTGRVKQVVSFDNIYKYVHNTCVGSCRYEVEVATKGGHSFIDFGNANAINALSNIITEIYKIEVPKKEDSTTTYNVGTVSGGTSVNTIAQNAKMLCEYRSDNVECLEIMKNKFTTIFEQAQNADTKVTVKVVGERPCAKDVDETKVEYMASLCKKIVEQVTGQEVQICSASTDCNIPLSLGVPAVCVGAYNGGGAHTREEWVEKATLPLSMEIVIRVIDGLLN